MWQQIDGYVAVYLIVGVLAYTYSSFRHVMKMQEGPVPSLLYSARYITLAPVALTGVVIMSAAKAAWDAAKCWSGVFSRGTEEILIGAFWLWGTAVLVSDGQYGFSLLTGLTSLYLWQAARAMQKNADTPTEKQSRAQGAHEAFILLAKVMAERGPDSYIMEGDIRHLANDFLQSANAGPSRELLTKCDTLRGQVVPVLAEEAREQRQALHESILREIKKRGSDIRASLAVK